MKTVFETCQPREDVLRGAVTDADFAADLAAVISGKGPADYVDPERFFANTYPTRGLKDLLENVCRRLGGAGGEAASIFRLDTSFGGGKTHGLIALCHAARSGAPADFIDPALLPTGPVRVAAFDGENADPANGREMGDGVRALTPWGEVAYALAGTDGYQRVQKSDEDRIAPGAETIREFFGGEPTLILLDELSVYLRKAGPAGRGQLTAFLTALFKAVDTTPNAALVFTLAIGKDGRATDAYKEENEWIADQMAEMERVSARKATLLNPTEADETVQVLRHRLFKSVDATAAREAADEYGKLWKTHREHLPETSGAGIQASYPLHPEVLEVLTGKTATLVTFQRVRGMLRLLTRTVAQLWETRPADATAIHLHHIDPGHGPIRQELVTRLEQQALVPAIEHDVASKQDRRALAQQLDAEHYGAGPPYASYVARTALMHTLAFNEQLQGVDKARLFFSMLGPAVDISFIGQAREKFMDGSAYLDDRPHAPMRFRAEANLSQLIRQTATAVDPDEVRAELHDNIRTIFSGKTLEPVLFPAEPAEVPDDAGDGRPKLAVLGYDAVALDASVRALPELVERIFARKGSTGAALRERLNNLVFVAAQKERVDEMRQKTRRRLALRDMRRSERIRSLPDHQQDKVRELAKTSEHEVAVAIQQCYRHLLYPSRSRVAGSSVDLGHTALDTQSVSEKPGSGQDAIVRSLVSLRKLRKPADDPDSPEWVRDQTPLKNGRISVLRLREEFRRNPALPMLVGDDVFLRGIEKGAESGAYVYRRGEVLWGKGDPQVTIQIDDESEILTMAQARQDKVWPRQESKPDPVPVPVPPPTPDPSVSFSAEGILKEALIKLWEQARGAKVKTITRLSIRCFDARDGFRLFSGAGSVVGAERAVTIEGRYQTPDGGSLRLDFRGPLADADPVREFLNAQLRAAAESNVTVGFEFNFNAGLPMKGDEAEKLTERLDRLSGGAANVHAEAEAAR